MAPVNKAKAAKAKAFTKSSKSSKSKAAKTQVKTKPTSILKTSSAAGKLSNNQRKKKRAYTDAELGVPKLNMITPAGVQKPRGKKKGKVFVDDAEGMATILAMVNAEKEGQIESKMMRARQMEEIREARAREAEKRAEEKKGKLDATKDSLRKRRKRKNDDSDVDPLPISNGSGTPSNAKSKKRVSFG